MQYESDTANRAMQNESTSKRSPTIPMSSTTPRYSLDLFTWGIGEDVIDRRLLFLQEPLSCVDLSLPQLIAALGLCHQPLDFDQDWLRRDGPICKGLPEPDVLVRPSLAAKIVNATDWPRALMTLDLSYERAERFDHHWTIVTLLQSLYRATRINCERASDLSLLQDAEVLVELLTWQHGDREIIGKRIPRTESHSNSVTVDQTLGLFGFDNGSGLTLCVYDTIPDKGRFTVSSFPEFFDTQRV